MRTEITNEAGLRDLLGVPMQRVLDRTSPSRRSIVNGSPPRRSACRDCRCRGRMRRLAEGRSGRLRDGRRRNDHRDPRATGNRRADGFVNIPQNPHVGLIFFVPGRGDTLRVNGRATLLSDAPYADHMVVKGHRPVVILAEVAVEQHLLPLLEGLPPACTLELAGT